MSFEFFISLPKNIMQTWYPHFPADWHPVINRTTPRRCVIPLAITSACLVYTDKIEIAKLTKHGRGYYWGVTRHDYVYKFIIEFIVIIDNSSATNRNNFFNVFSVLKR